MLDFSQKVLKKASTPLNPPPAKAWGRLVVFPAHPIPIPCLWRGTQGVAAPRNDR